MNLPIELLKHNTMMNDRLVEVCRTLTDEQLASTVEGTYGTIGATLVHIANGQDSYTARFFGNERTDRIGEDPFSGFDALSTLFDRTNSLLETAASQADGDGFVEVEGDDPVGKWRMHRSLLLIQAVNHGTEHRSQIATILTQLGITAPEMDGWSFFFDANHMEQISD